MSVIFACEYEYEIELEVHIISHIQNNLYLARDEGTRVSVEAC